MNENGWSLTSMLVFCGILLLGFFSAVVVAKKNFKDIFSNLETSNLTNSIENATSNDEKIVIDYTIYEKELKKAAENYVHNEKIKHKIINIKELIEYNYMKEIHDPKKYENLCSGYVIHDDEYFPYLKCPGNYATDGYNLDYEI